MASQLKQHHLIKLLQQQTSRPYNQLPAYIHMTFMRSDIALIAKFQSHAKSRKFEAKYIRLHANKRKVIATGPRY